MFVKKDGYDLGKILELLSEESKQKTYEQIFSLWNDPKGMHKREVRYLLLNILLAYYISNDNSKKSLRAGMVYALCMFLTENNITQSTVATAMSHDGIFELQIGQANPDSWIDLVSAMENFTLTADSKIPPIVVIKQNRVRDGWSEISKGLTDFIHVFFESPDDYIEPLKQLSVKHHNHTHHQDVEIDFATAAVLRDAIHRVDYNTAEPNALKDFLKLCVKLIPTANQFHRLGQEQIIEIEEESWLNKTIGDVLRDAIKILSIYVFGGLFIIYVYQRPSVFYPMMTVYIASAIYIFLLFNNGIGQAYRGLRTRRIIVRQWQSYLGINKDE